MNEGPFLPSIDPAPLRPVVSPLLIYSSSRLVPFVLPASYVFGDDPKKKFVNPPPFRITKGMVDAMGGQKSQPFQQFCRRALEGYKELRHNAVLIMSLLRLMKDAGIEALMNNADAKLQVGGRTSIYRLASPVTLLSFFLSFHCTFTHWLAHPINDPINDHRPRMRLPAASSRLARSRRFALVGSLATQTVEDRFRLDLTDEEAEAFFMGLIQESLTHVGIQVLEGFHNFARILR